MTPTPVPTPAPAPPAAAPVPAHHPWWSIMARIVEILAVAAPVAVSAITHDAAATQEAQQLAQLAGGIAAGFDGTTAA